ncbi:NACHT domain-containing protein [Streptomyces sp. NPDC058701]|uniref:NACHT domain-containing protein n=1 Tax=Streptomyces sp. NPDC058701 TaxID=3346608 RepID=UPI00365588FD
MLQSKFLQRPRGTSPDTTWFLGQVRAELRQWANKESKRVRQGALPEYLLFATNVVLSPDPVAGGIDLFESTVEELLAELELPVKAVHVWHFDQISRYLDMYPGIRQTYGALTTAGDVLFRLRELLEGTASDLGELLANHCSKELSTDQWVKMGQAGDAENQRLPLDEIAIDPTASYVSSDGTHKTVSVVRHILLHGDAVLRPSVRGSQEAPFVALIGGPGQGKSTIGQILCQVYRSTLLTDSMNRLDVETAEVVGSFNGELSRMGLDAPAARRWPVRVDLSDYADVVAGGEDLSILRYLSNRISLRTPDITASQLRSWLKSWPWLVVLDGLDEVASPQARDAVMEKINDFIIDAQSVDADLLLVATSRPQGYREEFSHRRYLHLRLENLDSEGAVAYAAQLTQLRHPGDPETAERVLLRLKEASEQELTARLMTTPLQVTIMAIILERRERVPQQRYRLFSDYYQTIYNREANKSGPVARLIDDYRTPIDHLHERVGLFLQVLAEREGDSNAAISKEDLFRITERYLSLSGEGYEPAVASVLAGRIVDAAMHRLILLVPRKEYSVGFEVRSLQEFMAARAIVTDDMEETCFFLKGIAPSAHWRNTWLLAAGRVFYDRPGFRDRIVTLLDEIQAADELSLCVKPGSSLAIGLLNDDVAAKAPRFLRGFTRHALEMIEDPLSEFESAYLAAALWTVGCADMPSRNSIEQAVSKTVAAGGHGAVNVLSLIHHFWEDETGPFAYQLCKHLDRAQENQADLASFIGGKLLGPSFIVSGLNDRSITLEEESLTEVVAPYLDLSAVRNPDQIREDIFGHLSISFYRCPDGTRVALGYGSAGDWGNRSGAAMGEEGVAEAIISAYENLPIELWMVRFVLRERCEWLQEALPVGLSLLQSASWFEELAELLASGRD